MILLILLWLVFLALLSYWLTEKLIALFISYSILDTPNARSNHSFPTPRGGGVAILIAFFVGCLPAVIWGKSMTYAPLYLCTALAILSIISFSDDVKHVSIPLRLIAHFAAAVLGGAAIQDHGAIFGWPEGIETMIIVLAIVGFINLFNFIDGLDGMASAQAIYLGLSLAYFYWLIDSHSAYIYISLLLVAVVSGFLWHNWHPARIFLGDVGSITIGFVLAILLGILAAKGHLLQSAILSMYCFADAGFILLKRMYKLEKVWVAHTQHFFQKAVRRGRSHGEVVVKVSIGNSCLFLWALTTFSLESHGVLVRWDTKALALLPAILIMMLTIRMLPIPMPWLDWRRH